METEPSELEFIDIRVTQLFALVSEALARATQALLGNDAATGLGVVDGDQVVDDLTAEVELLVWRQLAQESTNTSVLRHLVGILLILPELERSGDLAEHIAQRRFPTLAPK
jgi:phosphate transport system protein